MPSTLHPSVVAIADAGVVRLADLYAQWVYLRDNNQPNNKLGLAIIDLRQKIEALALTTDPIELAKFKADLQETYGLLAVYTDPLLRPRLPDVSAGGNEVVTLVLNINGFDVVVNGNLVGVGAFLRPAVPIYTTTLLPGQTVASIAYNGLDGTQFSLNVPQPLLPGAALYLRLYVEGVQQGRVDFPDSLVGQGFALLVGTTTYAGVFQTTADSTLTLSLPD